MSDCIDKNDESVSNSAWYKVEKLGFLKLNFETDKKLMDLEICDDEEFKLNMRGGWYASISQGQLVG